MCTMKFPQGFNAALGEVTSDTDGVVRHILIYQ